MKSVHSNLFIPAVLGLLAGLVCPAGAATTFVWNVASPGANNWNVNTDWTPNTGNPGSADTALFGVTGTAANATTVNNVVSVTTAITGLSYTNNTSGTWHVTQIPAGVTLTASGTVLVGGGTLDGAITSAAMVGGGALVASGNTFTIGNSGSSSLSAASILDLSGLSNFVYNAAPGTLGMGIANRSVGSLSLANGSNYVTAATISLDTGSTSSSGQAGNLKFGATTNVINVGAINVGAGRTAGTVAFVTTTGGLRMRGTAGGDGDRVATVVLGNRNTGSSSAGQTTGTMNLNGHPADVKIATVTLGQNSQTANTNLNGVGVFQFDQGTANITTVNMGVCGGNSATLNLTNGAIGALTVGANGTLLVNGVSLANVTSTALGSFANGTLNVFGGTAICSNNIVKTTAGLSTGTVAVATGTLVVQGTLGTVAIPLDNLNLTNATLQLAASSTTTNAAVANLVLGGANNTLNVSSLPPITAYPAQFPLIKYAGAIGGVGFNFTLGTLPAASPVFQGYISNNTTTLTVDVVITNGPVPAKPVLWTAAVNASWDTSTLNWQSSGGAANYNQNDFATFDDTASSGTVNLSTALTPGSLTVNNQTLVYTFNGTGNISGGTGLVKQGSGTLILDNSTANDFSGGVSLTGTLQVGAGDANGSLPAGAAITDNGTLVLAHTDNISVGNAISGSGGLTQNGSGVLTVSGNNSFAGNVDISQGTLKVNNANALGSGGSGVTISSGGTLDMNGFAPTNEVVTVSGAGVGGNGAIINSGAQVFPALTNIVMAGDTTFGGTGRWDLRSGNTVVTNAILSTGGNAYKLTKVGTNQVGLVAALVDPALGDIDVQGGLLSFEKVITSMGDPSKTLTVHSGAGWQFFQISNTLSKVVVMQDGGYHNNNSGPAIFGGPITLQGSNAFVGTGTSLELTNRVTGPGTFIKISTSNLTLDATNDFAGGLIITAGGVRFNSSAAAGTGVITVSPTNGNVTLRNLAPVVVSIVTNSIVMNAGTSLVALDEDGGTGVGNITFSGNISGNGPVIRGFNATAADGTVTLSGNNSGWSGGLTLARGTLALGSPTALGTGALTLQGVTNSSYTPMYLQATTPLTGVNAIANAVNANTNFTIRGGTDIEFSGPVSLGAITRSVTNLNTGATIFSGVIGGAAGLNVEGTGTLTLNGADTYAGTTTVDGGTLVVNGSLASASVVVNAGATLGGNGTIWGPVTANGGSVGAGSSPGLLTLTNGLNLSNAGTNVWELGANSDKNAGTDFDQISITGGNLVLGGGSHLLVKFIGSATVPSTSNAFWQVSHSWRVITLSGTAANSGNSNFAFIDGVGGAAGTFSSSVDGRGSIILTFTPSFPAIAQQPANTTVAPGMDAGFSVTATGTGPLSYNWHLGCRPGDPRYPDCECPTCPASITVSNVQYSQNGSIYYVIVSNAFGSVTSTVATLTVLPPSYPVDIASNTPALIANQLDHGSNRLDEVLPSVPDGSQLFKYNNSDGTWSFSTFSAAEAHWLNSDSITLSPGEGAFFQSPASCTLTFHGTPHVPVLPVSIPAGATYLLSRQTNDIGTFDNIVGTAPPDGATVYKWNGSGYVVFVADSGSPTGWDDNSGANPVPAPSAAIGEALWISPGGTPPPPVPQGYTVNIQPGLNLIANQLDHGSNRLDEIIANQLDHGSNTVFAVPDGAAFYKYNNSDGSWTISTYSASVGRWLDGDSITLNPGEGAVLDSPSGFTLAFTGTPHVPILPVSVPNGQAYLLSRQTNDVGSYDNIIGSPPADGAKVYQWAGGYTAYQYDGLGGVWAPSTPALAVGEAAWISPSGGGTPVNPPSFTNFTVISPAGGDSLCGGSSTTILWTGGLPSWNVKIALIDIPSWTTYSTITPSTPNTGSYPWTVPVALPASTYAIYIQEVSAITWIYGGNFTVTGPCPTNSCLPVPPGLGLWLPFDEVTGSTSANLVAGGNNGTHVNNPMVLGGYVANSLSFNGVNQSVTVPDYPAIDPGAGQDFSIDAWVKRATNSPNSPPSIIVDKRDPNSGVGYSLALSYGNLVFQMNDGSGFNNFRDTGTVPPDNQWHLVAVTVIRGQTNGGQFYIDGSPTGTFDPTVNPGSLGSTAPFQVAASALGGNVAWLGGIDEVEYFQRSVLASEVQSIYLAGSAGKCKCLPPPSNMTLWLPLDEPYGGTSANLAPGGNNGNWVNSPTVISGYVSNSLYFNGSGQWVAVPDYAGIDPAAGQDFSIDAWILRASGSPNSPPSVIVDKRDNNTGVGYSLALSYGNLVFQMNDGSGFTNFRDTGTIPADNKWHLVAVTVLRNQTNGGRFYIDGSPTGTFDPTPYLGSLASTASFQVAASPLGGNIPWLGGIDEAEFFTRVLAPQEVQSIYSVGAAGKCKHGCGVALVVTCPTKKLVACGSTWTFDAPTAVEQGCTNIAITVIDTVTNASSLGPCAQDITRSWLIIDCCQMSNTCSQTVTTINTNPPILICGKDLTVECGSAWEFTPPVVVDPCCGAKVGLIVVGTVTNGSGCSQVITRTWKAIGCCGLTSTCSQTITTVDTTPPVFTTYCTTNHIVLGGNNFTAPLPASPSAGLLARLQAAGITQFKGFDECSVNTYFAHTITNLPSCITAATLTVRMLPCGDNCENDALGLSFTDASGTLQTNATWSHYLGGGNPTPGFVPDDWCSHTGGEVFVLDLSALPQSSGPALNLLPYLNSNGFLDFTAQDDSGVDYLVLDVVSCCCAPSKTVECNSQWNFDPPTATDACCGTNVMITVLGTTTNVSPVNPCSMVITRTWQATDCCSNSSVCSQTVTVADRTPPVVNCSPGFGTDCSVQWSFTPPTAVDACSGTNVTITELNTTTNGHCPYAISRVWLVGDACGNSTTCTQTVVVGDFTPPMISCTASKTVECGSQWDFDRPAAYDGCSGNNVTISVLSTISNGPPCSQAITRTWVATDPCGNTNTCSQTVFTQDTTPPEVACSRDKTVECSSQWTFDPPAAVDACCGANVAISVLNTSTNSGGLKCTSYLTRTWTITDCCGNSTNCAQTVTVTDTTPPVFATSCVTNDILLGGNNFTSPLPASPSAGLLARLHAAGITQFKGFDQCTVNAYFAHTFTNLPHCIIAATLKVRMKPCGDVCYNDAIGLSFTSAGGILQSNSWSRYLGAGNPQAGLDSDNWCNHTSGQVFTFNLAALPQVGGPALNLLPQLNSLGYLDFTAQDDSGVDYLELNISSCCYQPNKTVECGSQWTFDAPSATDACCTNVTVAVFSTVTNGICPKVATRTWKATDCCGNSSFFSQNVTMVDTTPPIVYFPGPMTIYTCSNSAKVYYYVYAYDACSGYRPVTCTPASGSVFPLGTTTVSCSATDLCGNVGSCSFSVTVTQQILTASVLLGLADCYKLPTEPAIKSAALLAAHPGSCWKAFDQTTVNCAWGASFMGLPRNITCGNLSITMKPNCTDIPMNDSLSIGLVTNSGGFANAWSSYIGGGQGGPSLTPATWCGQGGCAQTFSLNLASMPAPGGNLLPLMSSQGKLDLYVQDDTTVDSARLNYCYCQVPNPWSGYNWNLSNAALAPGQGFASFSPWWLLGYQTNFTVSFVPGATHGVQLGLVPLNLSGISNSSMIVSAETTLDPDHDGIQLTGDGNGRYTFLQNSRRAKTSEATVNIRLAGVPTGQTNRPPIPGTTLLSLDGAGSLISVMVSGDGTTYSFLFDAPGASAEFGGAPADEVDVTFVQTDPSPENLIAAVDLDMDGLPDLQVSSASVQVTGLFPQVTGDASAVAAGDQLSISLNDPNSPCGFLLPTAPASSLAVTLDVAQNLNGTSESNGLLAGTFTGIVGPDLVEVSHFSFTQSSSGWDLDGDFAALGTTALHCQLYHQGALVADVAFTGQPHVPVLPARIGLEVSTQGTWSSFLWNDPQSIQLGGAPYVGDELRLLPVAPDLTLSAITALQVEASGIDTLTLSSAGLAIPIWLLDTPLITPDNMTIHWIGPADGLLESAPTVFGPWSPVPGQSNNTAILGSPLTNGVPSQFFRVRSN